MQPFYLKLNSRVRLSMSQSKGQIAQGCLLKMAEACEFWKTLRNYSAWDWGTYFALTTFSLLLTGFSFLIPMLLSSAKP